MPVLSRGYTALSFTVLAFLAIYRQIRDFGLLFGDGKFELAIYRQLPKFRDFEPQDWRIWRILENPCDFGEIQTKKTIFQGIFYLTLTRSKTR